jgi:hypothetical protein
MSQPTTVVRRGPRQLTPAVARHVFVALGRARAGARRAAQSVLLDVSVGRGEVGEGVISAAIAVLIMAFLGVGLWIAFHQTLDSATHAVNQQVSKLGS